MELKNLEKICPLLLEIASFPHLPETDETYNEVKFVRVSFNGHVEMVVKRGETSGIREFDVIRETYAHKIMSLAIDYQHQLEELASIICPAVAAEDLNSLIGDAQNEERKKSIEEAQAKEWKKEEERWEKIANDAKNAREKMKLDENEKEAEEYLRQLDEAAKKARKRKTTRSKKRLKHTPKLPGSRRK